MPPAKVQKMMRANTAFAIDVKGIPLSVHKGDLFAADDPVVKQVPVFFEEAEDTVRSSVEQATAAPGEKRGA